MVLCRCVCILIGRKEKNKGTERSSRGGLKTQLDDVQRPGISSESRDLKPATLDVTVHCGVQKNSRCNVRVMSLESPVKTEVEEAYEGEDEHDESPSIKREFSDFDLQVHEAAASKGGYDPSNEEIKYPSLYENQANIQLGDKDHKYSKKSDDIIQSGHVSDPGIGKANFWASPKLKRSCSNLERRDVLRNTFHLFPSSKSQSFEDLQELSAYQMVNLESPRSVMTHCSADRVMLKKHSSSQVLPSRSKRLWWRLFLWSHRNIHRSQLSKPTQIHPASAALKGHCGYSSDTLEPKQGKALGQVESPSPGSSFGEYFHKSCDDKNTDNQRWSRFQKENFGFWPQNQWVAFSTESSSFSRVDDWVKDLEIQQPPPEDDFDDDNIGSIAFPPSPDAIPQFIASSSTAQLVRHPDANLSKEILNANSVVQSLNPASTAAHISGIGIKAIPTISHFSTLRSVNLSSNLVVHITPGFLPKGIHTLNLSRNKISTIEGLRELTRLRVLDLSYNRISRIGQGLSNCTQVKELYLAGNKISDVEGLHRLLKLKVLDLSFNKIATTKALGQLVANYNSLQALNLLGNPIQSNISDDQLRKVVCGLLPKLVHLNKQCIKPQRGREILTDSVAKAALGNSSRSSHRRALKKGGGQGGSSSSSLHRSSASVSQKSRNRSRSGTKHH
ncbi:phosphatase 1 regulatory subunit pprA [Spatholobus suberectus]|nr:phosphatase 1 regulatory subunit pprA [Spatholobus suberectus]